MSTEQLQREIARRRTFAIISHPDAGKTTLTEKLLLYGGAIHLAGSVRARRNQRSATSDWMELERERGYTVWSARSGAEALRLMKDHGEAIQMLLTDIVMPQMGGQALAQMLKQQKPELHVLYMSGYAQESYATLDALNLEKNFIQKPFTPPALARKVRDVLDAH